MDTSKWSHCPTCGREKPCGSCAWCALRIDKDGYAMIRLMEWVTRKQSPAPCSVKGCGKYTRYLYRPLGVSKAEKGRYCKDHLPFNEATEAERVIGWLARKAYGLA